LHTEGWFFGSSTGINLCAAVKVAKQMGPGHTIVTILCDSGSKYQSRLFNSDFLAAKGLTPWRPQRPLKTGSRFSTKALAASR
jgi:cysteine synthase A